MESGIITLDLLKKGQEAEIISIECEDKALRAHILNMGLTPGVQTSLIKTAPMGDPLEVRVRGYILTLRKADAAKIKVKNVHNTVKKIQKRKISAETEHSQIGESLQYINKNKMPVKTKIRLALTGNQNTGKTTLFNVLTGSSQKTGNFPGVTVEMTEGAVKGDKDLSITDLPGIYSLSPYSREEIVTRDFILNEKPDGIINIVDAANIERNLLLTMQLIELNIPMVIALNMMDEIEANSGSIDINGLERLLGVPAVPISAVKNEGINELIEHAANAARYQDKPNRLDFCENEEECGKSAVHRCIHAIIHQIEDHAKAADIPVRFAASKLVEDDILIKNALMLDDNELEVIEKEIVQMEKETGMDRISALADMRFSFIEKICSKFVYKPEDTKEYEFSNRLDKFLTGKYTAVPAFFCIMAFILFMTFGPIGTFLSDITERCIQFITDAADSALAAYGLNPAVHSLIIDGIFAGVGSVLSFLPVIVLMFFFLSILEDSGYMARAAFVMDKALRKIGLSGRSFAPLLIGFGCSVPAVMASRTMPSERDRKLTILLTPFMSCSAKLPIYAFFTAAFFEGSEVLVVLSLYAIGIITGIIFALCIKKFAFKGNPVPFIMELPNYRFPNAANVWRLIYVRAADFITKAFTIIFWAVIAVWFLQHFDSRLNLVQNTSESLLAWLGSLLAPVFQPLGMSDWKISAAFISGFLAKENVVGALTVAIGGDVTKLPEYFTKLTAFVFLVFSLLYTPCAAAAAAVRRELGRRYAFAVVFVQCSIAWFVSFIVYKIGSIFI